LRSRNGDQGSFKIGGEGQHCRSSGAAVLNEIFKRAAVEVSHIGTSWDRDLMEPYGAVGV
jgi:hypothetical protein